MLLTRQNNEELENLIRLMEEMANASIEPVGKRQSGEIGTFEKTPPPLDLK
jgi:hypothetical protein